MGAADDEALDGVAFAGLIEPLGPFEPNPSVAVAVPAGRTAGPSRCWPRPGRPGAAGP